MRAWCTYRRPVPARESTGFRRLGSTLKLSDHCVCSREQRISPDNRAEFSRVCDVPAQSELHHARLLLTLLKALCLSIVLPLSLPSLLSSSRLPASGFVGLGYFLCRLVWLLSGRLMRFSSVFFSLLVGPGMPSQLAQSCTCISLAVRLPSSSVCSTVISRSGAHFHLTSPPA